MPQKPVIVFMMIAYLCVGYFSFSQAQILDQTVADSLIDIILTKELADSAKYHLAMDIADYATNPTISLKYAKEALEIANSTSRHSQQAAAQLHIGLAYKKLGDNEKALHAILKSISLYQKGNSVLGVGSGYISLGDVYSLQDDFPLALRYYNQAIDIFREEQDTLRLATSLFNTGDIYHEHNQFDSALLYYQEARQLFEMIGIEAGVAYALGNIGLVKTSLGDFEAGYEHLTAAIQILQPMGDNYAIAQYQLSLADIYQEKGNLNKAINYAQHGWNIARQDKLLEQMRNTSNKLSELYAQQKNYEKAYQFQSKYLAFRDSLNNEEVIQNMANMRTEFEVEQKQAEIELLEKNREVQNLIQYGLILLTVLLIIIALLLFGNNKLHKKANRLLARQKEELHEKNEELDALNATREKFFSLISHDLRGPVNALPGLSGLIKAYIHEKNYEALPEIATHMEKAALHLSLLLDNLLSWAMNQKGDIPLQPEQLSVKEIAEEVVGVFQTMAISKKIELYTRIEQPMYVWVDTNALFTILRNLTNNALKFTPINGEVFIDAQAEGEHILVQVADNGVGMSEEKIEALFHHKENERTWGTSGEKGVGLGLQLVSEFVKRSNGSIKVVSTEGKGTIFEILLPAYDEKLVEVMTKKG